VKEWYFVIKLLVVVKAHQAIDH